MMSLMPFGFMFTFIIFFGTTLSISSLHWLSIWAGLEINLMGFIPILIYGGMTREAESGMKYFIMQALGSGMIMLGSLLCFNTILTWETPSSNFITPSLLPLVFGLMLKLGGFPFHFWLPSVMAGISWVGCLILTTWQKLAPLFLLAALITLSADSLYFISPLLLLMGGASALVGGVGGLNQTQIRALLAYSSISHMGWMLLCVITSNSALKVYFLVYFIISSCMFISLWASEKSLFRQTSYMSISQSKFNELTMVLMLLSLGGMPPLLGFFSKWVAIWSSVNHSFYLPIFPLLIGSLISLFYYLSLLFSVALLSGSSLTNFNSLNLNNILPNSLNLKKNSLNLKFTATISLVFLLNLLGGIFIILTLPVTEFL